MKANRLLLVTALAIGIGAASVTLSQDKGTAHPMKPATKRFTGRS